MNGLTRKKASENCIHQVHRGDRVTSHPSVSSSEKEDEKMDEASSFIGGGGEGDSVEKLLPSNQDKEITKAPCPTLTEFLIAKQMTQLSTKDREEIYHDIHGVSTVIDEDAEPGFLDRKLREFQRELDSTEDSQKAAYLEAYERNAAYVLDRDLRLRFLRSDRFNPVPAAQRYMRFFEVQSELFGRETLGSCITQENLGEEGRDALYAGCNMLLPQRDSAGRAVWLYVGNPKQQAYSALATVRSCIEIESVYFGILLNCSLTEIPIVIFTSHFSL
jgi:hypothetical protein